MKWTGVLTFAALTLLIGAFSGCGDADRLKELEAKSDALAKDNDSLRARVKQLDANVASLTQERDELKAATQRPAIDPAVAAATAASVPAPSKATKAAKKSKKRHHTR